ncbi:MAG: hypothetical protein WBW41_20305 [Verrucomicrobiia bacterium]
MKKLTLIGLFIGALAVGMIIGAYVGARLASRVFARMAYAKPEVDVASHAAQEAEWLAELRLGESKSAISDMENSMNIEVATLAIWDAVAPPDDQTLQAQDRWLVPVKVYRESYPATGDDVDRINGLLSRVPGRNPKSICTSGVCRLDDLRLAKLKATTNSP